MYPRRVHLSITWHGDAGEAIAKIWEGNYEAFPKR